MVFISAKQLGRWANQQLAEAALIEKKIGSKQFVSVREMLVGLAGISMGAGDDFFGFAPQR